MMSRINDIQSGIEEKIYNDCSFIPSISDCCITQQLHIGRVARLADISISILHYTLQSRGASNQYKVKQVHSYISQSEDTVPGSRY